MTRRLRMTMTAVLIVAAYSGCRTGRVAQSAISEEDAIRLAKRHIADAGAAQTFTRFTVVQPGHAMIYAWKDKDGHERTGNATDFYGELIQESYVIECSREPKSASDGVISRTVLVNRISGEVHRHELSRE